MKKLLSIAIVFIMVAMLGTTLVNAVSSSDLANQLYSIGQKYGMTSADKVKIDRYLADNPVSEADANKVIAKANEAAAIMDAAGTTNIKDLTTAQKNQLKDIANEAATVVGVTLKFGTSSVEVYKDGKLVETVTSNNGKLAYTGNDSNTALLVGSSIVAVIALASAGIVVANKKRLANAQ